MAHRMRTALLMLCVAVLACLRAAAADPGVDAPLDLQTRTLANGLVVAVVRNPSVPLATIEIGVHNGAMNEPPALNGLSHLYEHMFFKGNAVIPDQPAYMRALRALGASWNGTTDNERVNYFFTVGAGRLAPAMQFMADAIRSPRFDPAELEREKAVVLGEYDRNEADPAWHLERAMTRALFAAHPSRKDPLGSRTAIQAATVTQMKWMQQVYYVPNNSILVVTGDVEVAQVFALAERCFGDWKAGPDPFVTHPIVTHPPLRRSQVVRVSQPVETVTIRLDWQGPSTADDMRGAVAADVFSLAVSQDDARLRAALVDSGLASDVSLTYATLRNTGQIRMNIETTPASARAAIRAALAQARRFSHADYVTEAQWRNAQTLLAVSDLLERERASEFAHTLTFWFAVDSLQGYRDYIPTAARTTRADGAAYAHRYITHRPLVLGLMASPAAQRAHGLDLGALRALIDAEWPAAAQAATPTPASTPILGAAETSSAPPATPDAAARSPVAPSRWLGAHTAELVRDVEAFDVDGIPVLLRHNPAAPVVAVSTFFRCGSIDLTPRTQGIAALALTAASSGGTRGLSRVARARALAAVGTLLSCDAGVDDAHMDMVCVSPLFERSFDLYAAGIQSPTFDPHDVALFRRQQVQALRQEDEDPDSAVKRLAEQAFFAGHPYALRPYGTVQSVSSLTRNEVATFFSSLTTQRRMCIVMVGDIDRTRAERAVRRTLSGLPPGAPPRVVPAVEVRPAGDVRTLARALPTTYVRGMMAAVSPGQAGYAATYLATEVLSSRLFEELRTRRNLTYAVWSALSSRRSNYAALYVSSTRPDSSVRLMREALHALGHRPLSAAELEGHIATLVTGYLMGIETCADQADQIGHAHMVADRWQRAFTFVDEVQRQTPAQVQQAARRLEVSRAVWGVLGDLRGLDRRVFTRPLGR